MNKKVRASLVAFLCSLLILMPLVADAGWVTKEIGWHVTYRGGIDGTSIVQRDTSLTVLNGADVLDTTATFTLDDADPIPYGVVAPGIAQVNGIPTAMYAYKSDTTVIAFLDFQADTNATPTATLSSLTMLIDGKAAGYSSPVTSARGWVKADSALVNGAAGGTLIVGQESVGIPIRTISPYGNVQRWSVFRARTTTATGILSPVRCFLKYWKNDSSNPKLPSR